MSLGSWLMKLLHELFGGSSNPPNTSTSTTSSTTTTATTTRQEGEVTGVRRSLHIGINDYPGTRNDLQGCVNDAIEWQNLLKEKFGFKPTKTLLNGEAKVRTVVTEMEKLIEVSNPGDAIVITYSGHGSTVRDKNNDEEDGKDETWYLYDGNLLDDKIRELIHKLKDGVKLTVISDSCHSGTVTRGMMSAISENHRSKPRYMPPENDEVAIRMASLPTHRRFFLPEKDMKEVLLTGCLSTEYSYDAYFDKPMGAFSHTAINIIRDNDHMTYEDFYKEVRKRLPSSRYPQTPCLEGKNENKKELMFTEVSGKAHDL